MLCKEYCYEFFAVFVDMIVITELQSLGTTVNTIFPKNSSASGSNFVQDEVARVHALDLEFDYLSVVPKSAEIHILIPLESPEKENAK